MFFYKFYKVFSNTFFIEALGTSASGVQVKQYF